MNLKEESRGTVASIEVLDKGKELVVNRPPFNLHSRKGMRWCEPETYCKPSDVVAAQAPKQGTV